MGTLMRGAAAVTLVVAVLGMVVFMLIFRLDEARQAMRGRAWGHLVAWWKQRQSPRSSRQRLAQSLTFVLLAVVILGGIASAIGGGRLRGSDPSSQEADLRADAAAAQPALPDFLGTAHRTAPEIAAALSADLHPDGAADVVLAHHLPSVDALAAGGLQGKLDAPLLLTASAALSPATAAELERLGQPSVHILGGEETVAGPIEEQLAEAGHAVHRYAGRTGVETAVDIAVRHFPDARAAVLAPAFSRADSTERLAGILVSGSLAAASELPVLLTQPDELSSATADHLAASEIREVVVVGDETEIGPAVLDTLAGLGLSVSRLTGADRFATAVAVSSADVFTSEAGADVLLLVEGSGDDMWPAVSIAPAISGRAQAPALLSDGGALPAATRGALERRAGDRARVVCLPGVDASACTAAGEILAER